mmetsp:Transcript_31604/g.46101  ORF Transcript_31604/g.46101 Transcript_31604/m.46101 type:complete len:215 (-) Transcript_31604:1386-2030(-)
MSVNFPSVNVPVLSNTTFFTLPSASNRDPPFTIIPRCAAAARPAAYVTGVLIVSAHGQAITMIISPFRVQYLPISGPQNHGTVHIIPASKITTGVYVLAKESTSFSVGDRFACASSTSRISRDTAESSTVVVVLIFSCVSPILIEPPATVSPSLLLIGRASPVRLDSSTADDPSTMTPSAGILSPVRTLTILPICRLDAGTMTISPVFGFITLA